MSASRHLSPHQFGPVHKWLESDEGHEWQDHVRNAGSASQSGPAVRQGKGMFNVEDDLARYENAERAGLSTEKVSKAASSWSPDMGWYSRK